jgi:methylenetetrahydrofolate dehydrogenase (NADP+) / methenyltetrahydrofolate cyclohydrolase
MTLILDGRAVAAALRDEIKADVAGFVTERGRAPSLVAVEVGVNDASASYVRAIGRACANTGITFEHRQLDGAISAAEMEGAIAALRDDPTVDGVIVQMPLPAHLDATAVIETLGPQKDVDGLHPTNLGRLAQGLSSLVPNTPAGGMELLRRYEIGLAGRKAVVVGRSNVVGKPLALLMLHEHATVTVCHSRTPDLAAVVREADIVAVAIGRARMVDATMIKPGAVVLDFGINVDDSGTLCGDVDYESVAPIASAITPVPGGTGPVTNMMLLRNTLLAARRTM